MPSGAQKAPDYNQRILRAPDGFHLALGPLGCSGVPHTAARTILGALCGFHLTDPTPLGPPECPEVPQTEARAILGGVPRSAPDYSHSHFGSILRIFHPSVRLGAQKCPRLQPEPFWEHLTDPTSLDPPGCPEVRQTAARVLLRAPYGSYPPRSA